MFDRALCADAYVLGPSFKAQLDLFDDSKRDGGTVARRVLSVAPGVALPARGAINVHGEVFLVGGLHQDSFNGSVVRKKYVCHRADSLGMVRTLEQAILATAGTATYGARLWVKDMKEVDVSSKLNAFFNLYFAASEAIPVGSVVTLQGIMHLVRNSFVSAAGFRLAEADELPLTCLQSIVYTDKSGQAYDEANDAYGTLPPATVPVLWHRFQSGFENLRPAAEPFLPGDVTVNVSKASVAAAGTGDTFVMLGSTWRVLDVRDNGANVWMLHARRV